MKEEIINDQMAEDAKVARIIMAIFTVIVMCLCSYGLGKHFQKQETQEIKEIAGRMSDAIRWTLDWVAENKEIDSPTLEDGIAVYLWDDAVGPEVKLEDFSYCY